MSDIKALPLVFLMPHSACNCRCVMCDIWKDNSNLRQLTEADIRGLAASFKKLGTRRVVMSGGEALLNPRFFEFCRLLRAADVGITLLTTGLTLARNAAAVVEGVESVIVSLDGDEALHDSIRGVSGAYARLREGVAALKALSPGYRVTARSAVQRRNFMALSRTVASAKGLGLDQISLFPADVTSTAFNREVPWDGARQDDVRLAASELPQLRLAIETLLAERRADFDSGFVAEAPEKLWTIYIHYAALHGLNPFPPKACNAPWVSAVVEPDGAVRPCFFQPRVGSIRNETLEAVVNGGPAAGFRAGLDVGADEVCKRCVCPINLPMSGLEN